MEGEFRSTELQSVESTSVKERLRPHNSPLPPSLTVILPGRALCSVEAWPPSTPHPRSWVSRNSYQSDPYSQNKRFPEERSTAANVTGLPRFSPRWQDAHWPWRHDSVNRMFTHELNCKCVIRVNAQAVFCGGVSACVSLSCVVGLPDRRRDDRLNFNFK